MLDSAQRTPRQGETRSVGSRTALLGPHFLVYGIQGVSILGAKLLI